MLIHFTVLGPPQGKARARTFYNKALGRSVSMTPENTVLYENHIKACFLEQTDTKTRWFNSEPLEMRIEAYYPIPKSTSKKAREKMMHGDILPTKKPDADNVAKVICDALNGIAYHDDTQIVRLEVCKYYDEIPRVEVAIEDYAEGGD